MPYYETPNFEIKMLRHEQIKGPLPKAVATAGSGVKFDFFFTFSPSAVQQQHAPVASTPTLANQTK